MSSKLFPTLATVVIALAGAVAMTSALAVEAEQFNPAPGVKTRAEVKAELAAAKAEFGVIEHGDATVFKNEGAGHASRRASSLPAGLTSADVRDIAELTAGLRHSF